MIKIIFIVIGAILLIWFLLPFFSNRILNIGNMTGIGVSLVLLLYGIFFRQVNHFIGWFWQKGAGKVIEIIIGLCILAILVLAVMTMICMGRDMIDSASSVNAARSADKTAIILGCKVRGDRPSLMLVERLEAGYRYLTEHPAAGVIVSGGQGPDEIMTEADAMYNWLVEHGISADRIIREDASTDTHENLANSYAILTGADRDVIESNNNLNPIYLWTTDVVIVTNEFHEYRAVKIAREIGFDAEPLPAATAWWLFPTYYVREMYGILEDWFLV